MSKQSYPKRSVLSISISTALSILALNGITPTVYAQGESLEEVVITGSRIVRRDFQSNSPIVTVDAGDFETQTGLNIESYLNQLPTYNPASTPTTTQTDVQITPVNSVGIASISLRGFGANRSLVLVNGKRTTPINALMVTDINGIPSALIQRVETITGGASAVYGADAVAGVTNFILRDNFEGFEIDTQYGQTEQGDGEESRISAVLGANFADGRGNVTLGVERYNRDPVFERNHSHFTDVWANPLRAPGFFLQGINGFSCNPDMFQPNIVNNGGCPNVDTIDAMFADRPAGTNVISPNDVIPGIGYIFGGFDFNADGTIFRSGSAGGMSRYNGPINQEYGLRTALDGSRPPARHEYETLGWNNVDALASAPQERYSFFTAGNFDVTDTVNVYVRGTMAESKTRTQLFGTNAVGGWETGVPYSRATDSPVDPSLDYTDPAVVAAVLANPAAYPNPGFIPTGAAGAQHPVPHELAILLNSRANPDGVWHPNWNPQRSLPPRNTLNTNSVWQVEAGINFELPFRDWTGEAYASHAQSSTYNVAGGNLSLARYRALMNADDWGRGAEISGNSESTRPNFGAADITCTSGFYNTLFHGDQPLSQDCYDAINADLQTRSENIQDIVELNFQGSVMELPAGEMRAAFGYQNRRNTARFRPDILQSTSSFLDQVVGVYPTGSLDASMAVDDFYVEALVPVLSGITAIQQLDLELGVRFSEYEHTDSETTWKVLANWEVNDQLRLRGGFNRATRAPNLGELFLNPQEIFGGGSSFGDACGLRSNAPFGAGGVLPDPQQQPNEEPTQLAPGQTEAGAMSTFLICQEMMGGAGSDAVQQFYYTADAIGGAGSPFNWVQQRGNRNLQSEVADTWTLGFVASSPWQNPWLSGLTASFDWYKIEVEDAIMLYSLDYAAFRCFGTQVSSQAEAAAQAASEGCQLVPRDANSGGLLSTDLSYDNMATIKTSGFDVGLNWFGDLSDLVGLPGNLALSVQATVLDYYKTKESPSNFDVEIDWKGSLGPNLAGTNGGAYDYRLFSTATYMKDDWSLTLRWRYLPEVWSAGYARQMALIDNNQSVAAGGDGILLGYTPTTELKTNDYSVFDLSFNWNMNETFTVRGGVTNMFDTKPEFTARTAGMPVDSDLSICGSAPGCQNPTGWSLPGLGGFNGGYYDTMGRRFFVGLKASF